MKCCQTEMTCCLTELTAERDVLSAQTLLAISHRASKSERFKGGGDYHPSIAHVLLAEAARISARLSDIQSQAKFS